MDYDNYRGVGDYAGYILPSDNVEWPPYAAAIMYDLFVITDGDGHQFHPKQTVARRIDFFYEDEVAPFIAMLKQHLIIVPCVYRLTHVEFWESPLNGRRE